MAFFRWPPGLHKTLPISVTAFSMLVFSGCERAPSVDILGSFFPIWMFCLLAGISLTMLVRLLFVHAGLDGELGPRVVVYPSMVALFACSIWLFWFRY